MYNAEQFQAARRHQVDTLLGLSGKAFEGIERILELNLRTTRAAIDQTSQVALAAVTAPDVKSLIEAQAAATQPSTEKASAYGRDLLNICTSTGAELSRLAGASVSQARARFASVIERASNQVQESVNETLQEVVIAAEPEIEAIKNVDEVLRNAAAEGAMAAEAAAETVIVAPAAATVRNAPKTKRSAG